MKNYLIILSLFFSLAAIAQQPQYPDSGFTNKAEAKNLTMNGLKEGKWVEYDSSNEDNVKRRWYSLAVYKKGQLNGIVRTYRLTGVLDRETSYNNGQLNGRKIEYNSNGSIFSEEYWLNNRRKMFKTYFGDGKIESEGVDGKSKRYNESGLVLWEESYNNGKKNSTYYIYDDNGKLKSNVYYIDGMQTAVLNYDENGNEIK